MGRKYRRYATQQAIQTLEKIARALEVPTYQFSTTTRSRPSCRIFKSAIRLMKTHGVVQAKMRGVSKLRRLLGKSDEQHRKL